MKGRKVKYEKPVVKTYDERINRKAGCPCGVGWCGGAAMKKCG